jgi:hypothetical protein
MRARRETKNGSNKWWHLHWPREQALWISAKVVCLQMAERPSFVTGHNPVYVLAQPEMEKRRSPLA